MFELDRRRTVIIVVAAAVLLIIVVSGLSLWRRSASGPSATPPGPAATSGGQLPGGTSATPPPLGGAARQELDARLSVTRLARLFAERFGTFSSQSRYEGITALEPFGTDKFNRWLTDQYLPGLKRVNSSDAYSGETVSVLALDVPSLTSSASTVVVRMQRARTIGTAAPVITYPTLTLQLANTGGNWLVDSAVWGVAP